MALGSRQERSTERDVIGPEQQLYHLPPGFLKPLHLRIATETLLVLFLPPFLWKTQCLPFLPLCHPVISLLLWWIDMSEISDLTWVRFLICHTLRLFALKLVLSLCNTSIFISIYNVIQQQRGPEKCKGLIDIWPHLNLRVPGDQVIWSNVKAQ